MAATKEEIIEALKEMTLLEASELVKMIEEEFGVSAAAPAAVAVAAPGAEAAALGRTADCVGCVCPVPDCRENGRVYPAAGD